MQTNEPWGHSGRKQYLPPSSHPTAASSYCEPWGNAGCANWILAPGNWGVYRRNDFREPDSCIFPYTEKHQIPLRETSGFVPLTIILMFPTTCPVVQNFCIIWLFPLPPQSSSLRVSWDAASQDWSPKNSHQLKHNSIFRLWIIFCQQIITKY